MTHAHQRRETLRYLTSDALFWTSRLVSSLPGLFQKRLWSLTMLKKALWKMRAPHIRTWDCLRLCGLGGLLDLSGLSILVCSIRGWIQPFVVLPAPSVTSLDGCSQCDQHNDKNLQGKRKCYPESSLKASDKFWKYIRDYFSFSSDPKLFASSSLFLVFWFLRGSPLSVQEVQHLEQFLPS